MDKFITIGECCFRKSEISLVKKSKEEKSNKASLEPKEVFILEVYVRGLINIQAFKYDSLQERNDNYDLLLKILDRENR